MKKTLLFLLIFSTRLIAQDKISALSVNDFEAKLLTSPDAQLVDVRTPEEFGRGHLKKAQNINFQEDNFEEQIKAKLNKNRPVFVYCFSGGRSADAAFMMREIGFTQVYDLAGGFAKWTFSSKPYTTSISTTEPIAAFTYENVEKITQTNAFLLIDFYTAWCPPCKKMKPILYKIIDDNEKVKFLEIDAEKNDGVANAFGVEEYPTFVIFKYGKQVWRGTGEISETEFRSLLKKLQNN